MDTTKEYIEMSMALPDEIISAWEPHAGDFVFAKHGFSDYDHRKESDNGVLGIITKVQDDTFSIEPCGNGAVAWYSIKHSIPLWRQDQLQDIVVSKKAQYVNGFPGITFIIMFGQFANENRALFNSMEQLWLAFVMHKKYGKAWNADKKEWI